VTAAFRKRRSENKILEHRPGSDIQDDALGEAEAVQRADCSGKVSPVDRFGFASR